MQFFIEILQRTICKIITHLLSRFSSTMGDILETDQRSWRHRAWNGFYNGYCVLLSVRLVVYSFALQFSFEPYLRWDRLFVTILPTGSLHNHFGTLCWSMLPLCGPCLRYIFFIRIDPVMFDFYAYFLGLRQQFFLLNPQFKMDLKSARGVEETRSLVRIGINEMKRIWELSKYTNIF